MLKTKELAPTVLTVIVLRDVNITNNMGTSHRLNEYSVVPKQVNKYCICLGNKVPVIKLLLIILQRNPKSTSS